MNKHIKLLTLVLVGFSFSLGLSSQRSFGKVKGSELVWQEAQTIVSGNKYLITAQTGEDTYYLPAQKHTVTPVAAVFDVNLTSIKSWTFTFSEGKGYLIRDDDGNVLHCHGSGSVKLAADKDQGSESEHYWTLVNNELKTGANQQFTLSLEPSGSTKRWYETSHGRVSSLKFYTLVEQDSAASFATWIMAQESGEVVTPECNTKYNTAKTKWNALSSAEKEEFKTNENYDNARTRLTRWAAANQESIEDFYTGIVLGKRNEKESSNGIIFIITSLILSSAFLLSKRIKVKD